MSQLRTADFGLPVTDYPAGHRVAVAGAGVHRFAIFTAFCTFLLIIAGALVTGNDAGLSVPDWPLSFGRLMPPMIGGVFYEHSHRMIAATVGLLTVILAFWLWRVEPRPRVRQLGWIALGTVIAQGVLGGITVLFFLPVAVSVAHACLAQLFFCITVSLALFTSPKWPLPVAQHVPGEEKTRTLALATAVAIFLQLMVGAAFRHNGMGMVPHLLGSALVTAGVFWTVTEALRNHNRQPGVTPAALLLGGLLLGQLFLGGGSLAAKLYYQTAPQPMPVFVMVTTAHVAAGALTLGASVALVLLLYRGDQV